MRLQPRILLPLVFSAIALHLPLCASLCEDSIAFLEKATFALDEAECSDAHTTPVAARSTIRRLEKTATEMIDNDAVVPLSTLMKQLNRKSCNVRLSRPSLFRMTPAQIYERNRKSVLVVGGVYKCDRCGRWHVGATSGFLIGRAGVFVTCYHVVDSEKNHTMIAMTHDGRVFPVKEVLAASKRDDLAILRLDAKGAKFKPLAVSTKAPVGSTVCVISHPVRRFYTLTQGIVSQYFTKLQRGRTTPAMSITADFARGSSGAPIFNDRGAVVGVVESTSSVYYSVKDGKKENLQMVFKQCVPAQSLLKLIDAD